MKTTLRVSFSVALLVALAGCGNKGPLVHPPRPVDDMAAPATTAVPADSTLSTPASTMPAAPADALPVPASSTPAAPAEPPPPANGGG